jgi:hypothetical protein
MAGSVVYTGKELKGCEKLPLEEESYHHVLSHSVKTSFPG